VAGDGLRVVCAGRGAVCGAWQRRPAAL